MFVSSEPTHIVAPMCFSRCLLIAAQLCLFAHAAKQSLLFFDSEGQGHPQNLSCSRAGYVSRHFVKNSEVWLSHFRYDGVVRTGEVGEVTCAAPQLLRLWSLRFLH